MIKTVNVRGMKPTDTICYCGRACAGWKQSPLGNPFVIGKDGDRTEVIEKYAAWMRGIVRDGMKGNLREGNRLDAWNELIALTARLESGETIELGCWCKPLPCHTDIIAKAICYLAEK